MRRFVHSCTAPFIYLAFVLAAIVNVMVLGCNGPVFAHDVYQDQPRGKRCKAAEASTFIARWSTCGLRFSRVREVYGGSLSDISDAREALARRLLEGDGRASRSERRAAFNNSGVAEQASRLIDKVAREASQIGDEDVAAVKASGLSEEEIFELVICAAVGQATRQYEAGLAALRRAVGED